MLKESIQVHEQDGGSILFPAFMIQVVFSSNYFENSL